MELVYPDNMRSVAIALLLITGTACRSFAVGPHEVAILVNSQSASSLKTARQYATMRGIPADNIVPIQSLAATPPLAISRNEFVDQIWTPANAVLSKRGLKDQVLAWVYSTGFPTTVSTDPPVSITGITFLRGKLPEDPDDIRKARYASPLFVDPVSPDTTGQRSRTFDRIAPILGRDMPLPSFILGYAGERGNSTAEILSYLKKGTSADHTSPTGKVYFVLSKDIRTEARSWQFKGVAHELSRLGISSAAVDKMPGKEACIMGIMAGTPEFDPSEVGSFQPGAFADHLTSFAAVFNYKDQTKCSEWLRAGAVGTAGTVTEPYSAWPKFPHARMFVHYASGCTLIESFYQSVRCPLQILPIGDPLCQPWAPKPIIKVNSIPSKPVSGKFTCEAELEYGDIMTSGSLQWFVDGHPAGTGKTVTVDTEKLPPGKHTIRIVSRTYGAVRSQGFVEHSFEVKSDE